MKNTSHLVAADERGLPVTLLVAGVLVILFDFALHALVAPNAWTHDFFFKRSFVQWVLISAFAIGLVHLLRRLPPWLREKRALRELRATPDRLTFETLVGRRWRQIRAACEEHGRKNLGQYAKNLAEHDEAEVDAAYRISGDVVQILPLMGFFGTVFGLSHGLYRSFLATGGTNTKDFAKAIAIAFDNTLLGLALTIILFVIQSILRKREEAILLQLNLAANDAVAEAVQDPAKDPLQIAIEGLNTTLSTHESALKGLGTELEKSRKILESPFAELKAAIQSLALAVAKSISQEIAAAQETQHARIANLFPGLVEKLERFSELVDNRTRALPQLEQFAGSLGNGLESLKAELSVISSGIRSVAGQISDLAKNTTRPQLEELAGAIGSLGAELARREVAILERFAALDEARARIDAVAAETHSTAEAVAGFGTRLDAVPEERRTVEGLAASIKELAHALAQRDSLMLSDLQKSLTTHSREIKTEIRQPRTIRFVEAHQLPDGDGADPQK